jgi:phenylpropionate dioxygenase-like ring-hydroxylating dioxygenase large terminal subunit
VGFALVATRNTVPYNMEYGFVTARVRRAIHKPDMNALIPAAYYCSEEVFDRESTDIFARNWVFVGMRSAVAEHNEWIRTSVAGQSVVVQNFQGDIRCFQNVCSHRFCEIRLDEKGIGPLRCPYHGWTYDAEGVPVGIPHRPRFDGLTPECLGGLALLRYRVELCGDLIFVCLDADAHGLRVATGDFFAEVLAISSQMERQIDASEWDIDCNWKILVENTLEAYHVDFVHPQSFARLKANFGDFRFDALASSFLGSTNMDDPGVRRFTSGFPSRSRETEGYFHFSLFPSFLMSTSYGVVFSVQQIVPLSASKTWMRSTLFHRNPEPGTGMTEEMASLLFDSAATFNRRVLKEDQRICEAVQRGAARKLNNTGLLSEEEQRIGNFQRLYTSRLGDL